MSQRTPRQAISDRKMQKKERHRLALVWKTAGNGRCGRVSSWCWGHAKIATRTDAPALLEHLTYPSTTKDANQQQQNAVILTPSALRWSLRALETHGQSQRIEIGHFSGVLPPSMRGFSRTQKHLLDSYRRRDRCRYRCGSKSLSGMPSLSRILVWGSTWCTCPKPTFQR